MIKTGDVRCVLLQFGSIATPPNQILISHHAELRPVGKYPIGPILFRGYSLETVCVSLLFGVDGPHPNQSHKTHNLKLRDGPTEDHSSAGPFSFPPHETWRKYMRTPPITVPIEGVVDLLSMSRAAIERELRRTNSTFPRPFKVGVQRRYWLRTALEQWAIDRAAEETCAA